MVKKLGVQINGGIGAVVYCRLLRKRIPILKSCWTESLKKEVDPVVTNLESCCYHPDCKLHEGEKEP